jgi:hypothetical protein
LTISFFPIFLKHNGWQRRSVVEQEPGLGTKITLPPRAEGENTNCGSGSISSPVLFTTDLKKFYKKIMVADEVFENWLNFYPTT